MDGKQQFVSPEGCSDSIDGRADTAFCNPWTSWAKWAVNIDGWLVLADDCSKEAKETTQGSSWPPTTPRKFVQQGQPLALLPWVAWVTAVLTALVQSRSQQLTAETQVSSEIGNFWRSGREHSVRDGQRGSCQRGESLGKGSWTLDCVCQDHHLKKIPNPTKITNILSQNRGQQADKHLAPTNKSEFLCHWWLKIICPYETPLVK